MAVRRIGWLLALLCAFLPCTVEVIAQEQAVQPTRTEAETGDEAEQSETETDARNDDATADDAKAPDASGDNASTPAPELPKEITFPEFVTIPIVGSYGRAAVHVDPVDAAIVAGTFTMPSAGDELVAHDGRTSRWRKAKARDGVLPTRSIRGGYAAVEFEAPSAGVMMLEAKGHAAVYVNGDPYAGDPYAFGNFALPVVIRKGANMLLFHVAQSELTAKLVVPAEPIDLDDQRTTLPTLVRGESLDKQWASVSVVNATDKPLKDAVLVVQLDGHEPTRTPVAWLDSASRRQCGFEVAVPESLAQEVAELSVQLLDGDTVWADNRYELQVVDRAAIQVRTFQSRIDGSVQPYVVLPAVGAKANRRTETVSKNEDHSPGAIVALHTDGMTPRDFAAQYKGKSWAHVVVPGGRGLYPLDWEDWSRIDAGEALNDAQQQFNIEARRVYATGHGMGGHGALVLATTQPDRFAAVATTAAWPSLWTYGGGMPSYRNPSPVQAVLLRAATASDTLAQLRNLHAMGAFLLHGADDQDIPPEQSRQIVKSLADWHTDFAYHEQANVGNWWGAETVDAPAVMQFLEDRKLGDKTPTRISITTSDLGTLATSHWATIAAQEEQFANSRIDLQLSDNPLSITGTTENVQRLVIDKSAVPPKKPFVVKLDGGRAVMFRGMPAAGRVWLEKRDNRWRRRFSPDRSDKGPQRYGGMKAVFDHDVLLVYGTIGNAEENAWSRAKAHYDAATFAYRAAGAMEVIPDTEFDANQTKDRNVVVYGNVDTNRAWAALLSTTPVQVFRGRMKVASRPMQGNDLGFLMVRPRAGSNTRLVAAVGGTGLAGMRTTNRLRYFWAGVAYPDFLLLDSDALASGDIGIRVVGYFAEDWGIDEADFAWRDLAL